MDAPWLQALIKIEDQDLYYRMNHPVISMDRVSEEME